METYISVAILPLTGQKWCNLTELELPQYLKDKFNLITLKDDTIPGTFRGSHYDNIIPQLQEEYLSPEDVVDIYEDLSGYPVVTKDIINLKRFFGICSRYGLGIQQLPCDR